MKKLFLSVVLLSFLMISCSCIYQNDDSSFEHDTSAMICVKNVSGTLKVNGLGISDCSYDYYYDLACRLNNDLKIQDGESFYFQVDSNLYRTPTYCQGGHDMDCKYYSTHGSHIVYEKNNSWRCHIIIYHYDCSRCDYHTTVTVHTYCNR